MESKIELFQIISSLTEEDQSVVSGLHETAIALGYAPKISSAGKKPDDWKCEYTGGKPKRVLYTLRITGGQYSIRAKLFHLTEYTEDLESLSERCKASLLSASRNCDGRNSNCAGPVSFKVGDQSYSKCRHFFIFKDIKPEDMDGIRRLLQNEAKCYNMQNG
mgnify:CR=1 FL=1